MPVARTPWVTGSVSAFYLFDVAQAIDLASIARDFAGQASPAKVSDKSGGPSRLNYVNPPLVIAGDALGVAAGPNQVHVKFFDYGVISVRFTRAFSGDWNDLVACGQELIENETLEAEARAIAGKAADRVSSAVVSSAGGRSKPADWLSEDYAAFVINEFGDLTDAEAVLDTHGADIAQLLRGERQPLSAQERDEVLRHRLSYFGNDLVVPAWNAAFIYDHAASANATLEILEFANSQLLEFRFHDDQLEGELTRVYADLKHPRPLERWMGRRHRRTARRLHALLVEVNELSDRSENALKLVGELYLARLFTLVSARLGLDAWKRSVQDKLKTLDDISRFAVEQSAISQSNMLELIVVAILIIDLGFLLAGASK
jgi:hypothetical protein